MLRELTDGRGADAVIDAVGMEAHGSPIAKLAQQLAGLLPDVIGRTDDAEGRRRPTGRALLAIDVVRRGGTISLIGVYGGAADPLPMLHAVRQADPAADGPGQRQAVGATTSCRC